MLDRHMAPTPNTLIQIGDSDRCLNRCVFYRAALRTGPR